jgi:VIT1/CCC1 family predicted Fe2+/Mn2+ transporter
MTALPYVIGSYAVFAVLAVGLALSVTFRLGRAKARLQAADTRAAARRGTA